MKRRSFLKLAGAAAAATAAKPTALAEEWRFPRQLYCDIQDACDDWEMMDSEVPVVQAGWATVEVFEPEPAVKKHLAKRGIHLPPPGKYRMKDEPL